MSGVQRYPVRLLHRGVELALHIIHRLGHQVQAQLTVGVEVVQKTCYRSATNTAERRRGTELTVSVIRAIRQCGMRMNHLMSNTQHLPLIDIIVGDIRVIGSCISMVGELANDRHGLNTNNPLQSQVGLIAVDKV